jgi:hypothetical protein
MKSSIALVVITLFLFQSCAKETNDIVYTNDVENIMFNYCTSCHAGTAPASGLDLTTYQNVKNAATQGNLVQRINDPNNPMPASGLIAEADRQKIDDWVQAGCPE